MSESTTGATKNAPKKARPPKPSKHERNAELSESGMTHRQVMQALSGLLLGMFVSMIASTVVGTSMPLIISDLKGDQSAFTWVITATLLATTVSTPIWGKLADLFNRKLLLQLALVIFVLASAIAGFSQDSSMLITMRVFQGIGAGGLAALSQIVMADIISPRERGKYAGLFGAVMAIGTIGGPLLGGVITDSIGWRWNFFVAVPFAVAALILLQRTLHLPKRPARKVSIDYWGIVLITGGVSLLLIWVSQAGSQFEWASPTSFVMLGGALLMLALAVVAELKATEPIIPLGLFRSRTFTLAVVASISVGVAMFGTSVFLSQYMQLARGATPTESGLLTIPMMGGLLISSTIVGGLISRYGKWKAFVVSGSVMVVIGSAMLSFLHYDTNFWYVGVSMFVLGAGVGMLMQNLVLVVQNETAVKHMGVATSAVTFFRSLGGTIGVSVMGSILGTVVASNIKDQIMALDPKQQAVAMQHLGDGTIPTISTLPDFVKVIVESSYGTGVGTAFMVAVPLAVITLIAVIFIPNAKLGTQTALQRAKSDAAGDAPGTLRREIEDMEDALIEVGTATAGLATVGKAHPRDVESERVDAGASGSGQSKTTE